MTKTILLTLTYLVGIGELILAAYFWINNSKSEIRRVMSLLALSTGMWAITSGLTSYTTPSQLVSLSLSFLFFFGALTVTALLHLVLIFPYKIRPIDLLHITLLYVPVGLFASMSFFTKTIVASYSVSTDIVGYVHPGPLFSLYEVYISLVFFAALYILYRKIASLDGLHKKNSRIFFWSVLIGGFPAIALNLLFAFFGILVNPLIPVVFSLFWVGGTSYIITRK